MSAINTYKFTRQFARSNLAVTLRTNLLSNQLQLAQGLNTTAVKYASPKNDCGPKSEDTKDSCGPKGPKPNCSKLCDKPKVPKMPPCPPQKNKGKGQDTGSNTCQDNKSCLLPALLGLITGLGLGYLLLPAILGPLATASSPNPPSSGQSADPFQDIPKRKKCPPTDN